MQTVLKRPGHYITTLRNLPTRQLPLRHDSFRGQRLSHGLRAEDGIGKYRYTQRSGYAFGYVCHGALGEYHHIGIRCLGRDTLGKQTFELTLLHAETAVDHDLTHLYTPSRLTCRTLKTAIVWPRRTASRHMASFTITTGTPTRRAASCMA